jgi:hypothetical protein
MVLDSSGRKKRRKQNDAMGSVADCTRHAEGRGISQLQRPFPRTHWSFVSGQWVDQQANASRGAVEKNWRWISKWAWQLGHRKETVPKATMVHPNAAKGQVLIMAKKKARGLYANINARRKAGTSRPKSKSTVSPSAWKAMKRGFR